jgi:hypothetical protein
MCGACRKILYALICALVCLGKASFADSFDLEGGLLFIGNMPTGMPDNGSSVGLGFTGRAAYEISHWSLGAVTRGTVSTTAPVRLAPNGFNVDGISSRRGAAIGPNVRYFFQERHDERSKFKPIYYAEAGFLVIENEFSRANRLYDFDSSAADGRLFVEGYGVTLGGGVRLRDSPFFIQLNYEFDRFRRLQVVADRKELNQILFEPDLGESVVLHSVLFTFGISNVF